MPPRRGKKIARLSPTSIPNALQRLVQSARVIAGAPRSRVVGARVQVVPAQMCYDPRRGHQHISSWNAAPWPVRLAYYAVISDRW